VSPTGPVGFGWVFSNQAGRGGLPSACDCAARPRPAEMHKSKGKLSGVLHKGFKPDKWSVQIDFRPLPLPCGGGVVGGILTPAKLPRFDWWW